MVVNEDFTKFSKLADIGRWFINHFVKEVSAALPAGTKLLDAGAGECAYKKYFAHCEYKSVDLAAGNPTWAYGNLDYVAPLDKLPIDNGAFDAVLCTQVLEHLDHPRECMKELYRVLRPGGKLFVTVPMAQSEHQVPYDFFRYTSFGLRSLLSESGFQDIDIKPFGGMFTRWAYEIPRALTVFPAARSTEGLKFKGLLFYPLKRVSLIAVRATQFLLLRLDRLDKIRDDPFGWSATCKKPA